MMRTAHRTGANSQGIQACGLMLLLLLKPVGRAVRDVTFNSTSAL